MEPEDRPTKRERREQARKQRKERETHRQHESKQRRWLTVVGVIAGVIGIGALVWLAREEPPPTDIVVLASDAEAGAEAAGCTPIEMPPPASVVHLSEPAPPPAELYPVRPAHAGPHFVPTAPVGVFDSPLDERNVLHNMEHGAIVAWYDPDLLPGEDVRALETWAQDRNRAGFAGRGGTGVIVSPYPDPLDSGKAIAFRGWMHAIDCDRFDQDFADAFLATFFGTRGVAPEGPSFAPYPQGVLEIEGDVDIDDTDGDIEGDFDVDPDEPEDQPDDGDEGEGDG